MAQANNPYSLQAFLGFVANNFVIIVLVLLFFAGGVVTGSLWTENQMLRGGRGTTANNAVAGDTTVPQPAGPTGPTEAQLASLPEVDSDDHIIGNPNAKIVLVEYSDFECPFCQRFHPTMQQIMEEYGDDVAWVYRHFPLSFHPNARPAAITSECVAKLGGNNAFWKFADEAFNQNSQLGGTLTPAAIDAAIAASGVNADEVKSCVDAGDVASIVDTDMNEGSAAGVTGTPGTFIVTSDGAQELIPGALPFEQVKPMIDQYL
jgi:protein-disulfide isomerase